MANYIPFEKLEVGKSYYMLSSYWREVLGVATITEIDLMRGYGYVDTSWNPDEGSTHGRCRINANEHFMFDEMPTKEEQLKRLEERWHEKYVPPRELEGVRYSGKGIPEDWAEKLNELIRNLQNTILYDTRFKQDRNGNGWFIWESKLDYPVGALLMRSNGDCDWESIEYIKKVSEFDVHAGERDSSGWLTGVIEDPLTRHRILYG